MAMIKDFDGPIPGENFTSDTKNYAWHRPPDFTDLDDAIDWSIKKLSAKEAAFGLMTMLDMGLPIVHAARTFVMSGVGEGRWTPDFAILLAGPIARIMMTMGDAADIKYEMGLDNSKPPTKVFLEKMMELKQSNVNKGIEAIDPESIKEEAMSQGTPQEGNSALEEAPIAAPVSRGFASRSSTPINSTEGSM